MAVTFVCSSHLIHIDYIIYVNTEKKKRERMLDNSFNLLYIKYVKLHSQSEGALLLYQHQVQIRQHRYAALFLMEHQMRS